MGGNWSFKPLGDTYNEMENISNIVATVVSDTKKALENVCVSDINR